jgi:hypothetical protein
LNAGLLKAIASLTLQEMGVHSGVLFINDIRHPTHRRRIPL